MLFQIFGLKNLDTFFILEIRKIFSFFSLLFQFIGYFLLGQSYRRKTYVIMGEVYYRGFGCLLFRFDNLHFFQHYLPSFIGI